jgi:hypothetical protein
MTEVKIMRISSIAIGTLVALGLLCSHFFYFQSTSFQKKETKTEQHQQNESGDEQAYFSVPSTSLPSTTHADIQRDVFFLFEFVFERHTLRVPDLSVAIPLGQFFRVIFGLTISPNAP